MHVHKMGMFWGSGSTRFSFTRMAKLSFLLAVLFSAVAASGPSGVTHCFSRNVSPESMGLKKETLSHLHFYFYDNITGPNPTEVMIAEAAMTSESATFFGRVFLMDDPLTAEPEPSSKPVGRAQGMFAAASQEEVALLMVLIYAFTEGKYKGSSLSVLGRNAVFTGVREMAIVGGSGVFRFARGYALAKTHAINAETGNAVVEYDVYVFHYC